jgi:hypothetical protein
MLVEQGTCPGPGTRRSKSIITEKGLKLFAAQTPEEGTLDQSSAGNPKTFTRITWSPADAPIKVVASQIFEAW